MMKTAICFSGKTISAAILLIALLAPSIILSQVILDRINTFDDLVIGPNAGGHLNDFVIVSDTIKAVITDIGHSSQYTNTGGHIIDLDLIRGNGDLFNSLSTYFDNTFPYQANYSTAEIINDGTDGQPAVLRVSGVYSENSQVAVITDYTVAAGQPYIKIQTWLINSSSSAINDLELGDAIQWGATSHFAPGYGFALDGLTTTSSWLAASGEGTSYGYVSPDGNLTGPHGIAWSDPYCKTVSIPVGDTATYIRYLTVSDGDIATAANPLYDLANYQYGTLEGTILNSVTGQQPGWVTVDINSTGGVPFSQVFTQRSGQFETRLPGDNYHLTIGTPGYITQEFDIAITSGMTTPATFEITDSLGHPNYPLADTISYILRPIPNVPVISRRADNITIEVAADQSVADWQAGLYYKTLYFPLNIQSSFYFDVYKRWYLTVSFPDQIPMELYDLYVQTDSFADTVSNAVKIIDDFKSDFYFIQITDTHLPTPLFSSDVGYTSDTSDMADLWSVINDVNVLNPEFVLHTGDLVNEGELEDFMGARYFSRAKHILENFDVPVFMSVGNHDIGGWNDTYPIYGSSRRDWWRFFGWEYLDNTSGLGPFTQDYYFDYGNVRLIGLEAYDNYDSWRHTIYRDNSFIDLQIGWLHDVINSTLPSMTIVLFNHYDFNSELDIPTLGVDMNLYGHIHRDEGSLTEQPYNLATNNVSDGDRSFRVIAYDSTGLHPQPSFSAGSSGQNLTISYSPANDGTHDTVNVAIVNHYNFTFNHGLAVFKMPIADDYVVTGGNLWQVINLGSYAQCYVEISLTANATVNATIAAVPGSFVPGDANGDGNVLGSDVTYLINYFRGINPVPDPIYAGDANGDCRLIGSDVTYLVSFFRGVGEPPVDGHCE